LTDALKSRGLARDLIRQIQDLRKATGLEVSDRIKVWLLGADDLAEHFSLVASEVLAESLTQDPGNGAASPIDLDGRAAQVWIEKA